MGKKIELSFKEQVKLLLDRNGMTMVQLAENLGTTRQNLHNKFARDNFSEDEMEAIANAMGYELIISFEPKKEGEKQ